MPQTLQFLYALFGILPAARVRMARDLVQPGDIL